MFAPSAVSRSRSVLVVVNSSLKEFGSLLEGVWVSCFFHIAADGGLARIAEGTLYFARTYLIMVLIATLKQQLKSHKYANMCPRRYVVTWIQSKRA